LNGIVNPDIRENPGEGKDTEMRLSRRDVLKLGGVAAATGAGSWLWPCGASAARDFNELYNLPEGSIDNARKIIAAPHSISTSGKLNLGVFDKPLREMNLEDADLFSGVSGAGRRARMQEFIGYSFESGDWHVGIIIIDAKILCIGGLYVLSRRNHEVFQYERYGGGRSFSLARTLWNDRSYVKKHGFRIELEHHLDDGYHRISADVKGNRKKPDVSLDVTFLQDLEKYQPLVVSLPVEPRHYFYTQKASAPISGSITVDKDTQKLDPARDCSSMDEHRNYYPIPNRWAFGCFTGRDSQGRFLSVNMCDNAIKDQEHWNENCIWVDGQISLLGPVRFSFDYKDPMKPWTMKEKNGRLSLTMTPDGGNKPIKIPPIIYYYQKCGNYSGYIIDDHNIKYEVEGIYGEAENFEFG
jgi:hypothetical protein